MPTILSFDRRRIISMIAVLGMGSPAFAQFRVEVSGVGLTQLPIAIVALAGEAQSPQKISSVVRADLERSGRFRSVDTAGIVADENTRPD